MTTLGASLSYSRTKGILLVVMAATSWGVSGTVAQYLFHQQGFSTNWLVVIRLLLAGLGLLLFAHIVGKQNIWSFWKNKQDVLQLVLFGIFGMLGVQYTFFMAIEQGNAATATVLQYLAPVLIALYFCFRTKSLPVKHEVTAIVMALGGTFLLVTKGNIQALSISGSAFGWGMMIGGIGLSFFHPPWKVEGHWSPASFIAVAFVVLVGTLLAFLCFMESLKYIKAAEASLLACIEPLSAAFLAVAWLHVPFSPIEWIGALLIIATIFILSVVKR